LLKLGDVVSDTMIVLVTFSLFADGSTDAELESSIVVLDCNGVVSIPAHPRLVLAGTWELVVEFDHSGAVLEEVNVSVTGSGSTYEFATYELEAIAVEVLLSSVSVALVLTVGTGVVMLLETLAILEEYCGVSCSEMISVGSPLEDV
jgi:hypothetical protein